MSIGEGSTLTIDPGAIVKMKSRYGSISIIGTLKLGSNTSPDKAYITSYKDDTVGGDSNGDGDASLPTKDDWNDINFGHFDVVTGKLDIQNSVIRYGGNYYNQAMINITGPTSIDNSTLEYFGAYALGARGTTTIKNSTIANGRYAIKSASGSFKINNSRFENISRNVIIGRYDSRFTNTIDLRNNWWGKTTGPTVTTGEGPFGSPLISDISTDQQGLDANTILFDPWLTTDPALAPPPCTINCHSNILFLPGIMGSKLYEEANNNKVWDRASDSEQAKLAMDTNGYSLNNIHTSASTTHQTEGVIPEILGQNIYKSFMGDLAQMKTSTTIQDYALIPYDWRLPLTEIVAKGKEVDGKVYYGPTVPNLNDSFIVKELQRLVTGSKTGKVTIVAHSNGGLVTKELIQTLKETNNPLYDKIDKVIFVAVPQVGTPEAVLSILHGTQIARGFIMTSQTSRKLLENMPFAYNLLPSSEYFNRVNQTYFDDKIVNFDESSVFNAQRAQYGYTVDGTTELKNFLKGTDGRIKPNQTNLVSPNIGNDILFDSAVAMHQRLDSWTPSTSTELITIAGAGESTLSGISYVKKYSCTSSHEEVNILQQRKIICDQYDYVPTYKINTTVDGDGTVVVPSALYHPTDSTNIERWWVDLKEYGKQAFTIDRNHKDILEIQNLRDLIKSKVLGQTFTSDSVVSQTEVNYLGSANRLHYTLHSPLSLGITDTEGRYTGVSTSTGELIEQIPGSRYFEVGDIKMIALPQSTAHTVKLVGYKSGTFALDVDTVQGNTILASSTFSGIPSSTSTVVTLSVPANTGITSSSTLQIDQNGDGVVDTVLQASPNRDTVYDVTPPELQLTFSTSTKDVILSATDTIDSSSSIVIGTSTVMLKDNQNNITTINFKKLKDSPTKLVLVYNSIIRNGIAITTPNTRIEYDWKLDNQGNLKDLDTKVIIKRVEKNIFNYKKQTNQTTIKNKNIQTGQITTTIKIGLVPVTVTTNLANLLNITY